MNMLITRDKPPDPRPSFMREEDIRLVDAILTKIMQNQGQLGDTYSRWEDEEEAYAGDQPLVQHRPNSRINIVNANIEGQVAAIIDKDLAVTARGEGPSDQGFARWAEIGLDWTLRHNNIKRLLAKHERRRLKHGPAWLKAYWDPDAKKGFGMVRFTSPPLQHVFVDQKVTDPDDLQLADYIAEVMLRSKRWALDKYGDMAEHINYGASDPASTFQKEYTGDDEDAFWLVQVWLKTDGMLRKLDLSHDGILLEDSFQTWDGERFNEIEEPEPFYRYNEYPYWLTVMYPIEGKLLGFGDGKLLRPLQDMINDLYDQIRRAARPNRLFFDPASEVEVEEIDADDGPIPAIDPKQNIHMVEVGQVNPALWQLLGSIHQEVQRVVRFSELMLGQGGRSSDTATEAAIQQSQGSATTDHKKLMLQETLKDACKYALDLMIEHYTEGRWFRIDENEDNWHWIDFRQLDKVPAMIPPTDAFIEAWRERNPDEDLPEWAVLKDEDGNEMHKSVDLDLDISIGAGLPKNKAFLYQMLEKLSQMNIEDRPVVSWSEFRQFLRDWLAIPLEDDEMLEQQFAQQQQQMQGMEGLPPSPDVQGLSGMGNPMMGALPPGGMVGG